MPQAPKDLAMTKGLRTTYGSPIFRENVPQTDSVGVARMRAAGAIFIGKTNTPEFEPARIRSTKSTARRATRTT